MEDVEFQRTSWDALRRSINTLVNKVTASNITNVIPEMFAENLIRGRGLFCRSCLKSQMACPEFTDVFAALVAVINTRFPEVGLLLLRRVVFVQFRKAYMRNDKPQVIAAVKFIAHLANQRVVGELIALELLTVLLDKPTDDGVEVAVGFVKECGSLLLDVCPRGLDAVFERFRGILHEGCDVGKRVRFLIEGLFALRKAKFRGYPAIRKELDLVDEDEQFTHEVSLMADDEIDPQFYLDVFNPDPDFAENEKRYEQLKKQILGDQEKDEEDEECDDHEESESEIKDKTETDLINLRRSIYQTIMSSVGFEEGGHKLMQIMKGVERGQEMELCTMLLECCSNERSYLPYYGLLGQRFCTMSKVYREDFEQCFVQQYSTVHRLETNKIRNVASFFAHLLATDALTWDVLGYIRLNKEDTTSSCRIFIKFVFQILSEHIGIRSLNDRLLSRKEYCSIFPKDDPRFAINFFTCIGLGGITEKARDDLRRGREISGDESKSDDDNRRNKRRRRRRN